jgi:hypothetical protein
MQSRHNIFEIACFIGKMALYTICFDLKLLSNRYILTKGTSKNSMDTNYHKAANMTSGCRVGSNIISLIRYKNDWGSQQHP